MRKQVSKLKDERDSLQQQLDESREDAIRECSEMREEIERLSSSNKNLEEMNKSYIARINSLESEVSSLKSNPTPQQQTHTTAATTTLSSSSSPENGEYLKSVVSKNEALERQVDEYAAQILHMKKDSEDHQSLISKLTKDNADLKRKAKSLEEELKKHESSSASQMHLQLLREYEELKKPIVKETTEEHSSPAQSQCCRLQLIGDLLCTVFLGLKPQEDFRPHLTHFLKDWAEHFGDADHETYSNHTRSGLLSVTNQSSFYVSSCSFINQTNGAIYFIYNAESTRLLVEITTFDNCSLNQGGSLYFTSQGEIVQERVCYYKSISSSSSHVFHSIVTDKEKKKNFFKSSSVFECGNIDKQFGMTLGNGKLEFENINNTFSKASSYSGYIISNARPNSFVKFSNFCNLTENSLDIYEFSLMSSKNEGDAAFVTSSNFVNNNGKISALIGIWYSKMTVENCSIFDNTCEYTFGAKYGTITVRHCYFDKDTTKLNNRAEVIFESNVSSKFTNSFNETVYLCRPRVKQREETVLVDNKFIDALCMTVPIILQIQS